VARPDWTRPILFIGCYNRWKWGNETCVSSYQLQHNEYLYGTKTAITPWSSRSTSICYDSRPQWPDNGSRKWKPKTGIHSARYGALLTDSTIGGASCTHTGLQLGLGIALVPVHKSWCQLAKRSTVGSVDPRTSGCGGRGPGWPSGMPRECYRIYGSGGGVFQKKPQYPRYSNTPSNSLWRSPGQWAGHWAILSKSGRLYKAVGSDHGRHHGWWVR